MLTYMFSLQNDSIAGLKNLPHVITNAFISIAAVCYGMNRDYP